MKERMWCRFLCLALVLMAACWPGTLRSEDSLPKGARVRIGQVRPAACMICCVSFSPDGKLLAAGAPGHMIALIDPATGKIDRHIGQHDDDICGLQFSPDGKRIVSGSRDGSVRLWDTASGRELFRMVADGNGGVIDVAYAPDGKSIAAGSIDGNIRIWDPAKGALVRVFRAHNGVVDCVRFSSDSSTLATASWDNTARLWDAGTGKELHSLVGHAATVKSLDFHPDGKSVVSGSIDRSVKIWDRQTGKLLRQVGADLIKGGVNACGISPDGKVIAAPCVTGHVYFIEFATGKILRSIKAHDGHVAQALYSPDGKTLATAGYDGQVRLWDPATGQPLFGTGHHLAVTCLAFSNDGKLLASGSRDETVRIWESATGKQRVSMESVRETPRDLVFAADGRMLHGITHGFSTWYAETGRENHFWTVGQGFVHTAVSRDGVWLAYQNSLESALRSWDAEPHDDRELKLQGPFAFSPDGRMLAAFASEAHGLLLLEVPSGRVIRNVAYTAHPRYPPRVAFSADARCLLLFEPSRHVGFRQGTLGVVHIIEASTGQERFALTDNQDGGNQLAVSPNGRTVALGHADGTVRLVELRTGECFAELRGHASAIECLAFSPDGATLASAGADTAIFLWDMPRAAKPHTPVPGVKRLSAEACWATLADSDAKQAYEAMRQMIDSPDATLGLLGKRLKPDNAQPDPKQIQRLLGELDSDDFDTREQASETLAKWGESVRPDLEKHLATEPPLEPRKRLQKLLALLDERKLDRETLRGIRAVEALEQIATPDATALLKKLAEGAPISELTREAGRSLERLQSNRKWNHESAK